MTLEEFGLAPDPVNKRLVPIAGLLAATAKTAARFGRPCQVSVERIMGCGLGGCYSCVVPMRDDDGAFHHVRSCLAGPVLAADRIRWD